MPRRVGSTTNADLTLHNVQLADAGTYSVRVTNAAGSAEASATLSVSTVWLDVAGREPDDRLRLTLHSPAGTVCELLTSTNVATRLAEWTVITRLTNTTGPVSYTDPVTNLPGRFYRLRQVP